MSHDQADELHNEFCMMLTEKPWVRKAFELLFHAESHFRTGTDYDKRLALISFDNSIEVSISIYLSKGNQV